MSRSIKDWIAENRISEVECLVPDMNGVIRGKVWPANKFIDSVKSDSLRMPSSVFSVTVTGEYADEEKDSKSYSDPDVSLHPDPETLCVAPGFKTPTAFVFADAHYKGGGGPFEIAPELEFYLTQQNHDPDLPLVPPPGRTGRAETAPQPYGLEAINEYEDLIEEIYEYAEAASLHLDTMIHEAGTAQLEINFNHGDPVHLCDQVIIFKRIVRQVALKNGVYATFMAKPMENQPGSAMHIHISMVEKESGKNLFGAGPKNLKPLFRHFVGGLQKMRPSFSAPINLQWGYDNRSCGLRVPITDAQNTRVETRVPGADANPYLAAAAALVCGYIGMRDDIEPAPMVEGNAYLHDRTLPRNLDDALDRMLKCEPVIELLGERFVHAFHLIKADELRAYEGVISSWERDHLLLKV